VAIYEHAIELAPLEDFYYLFLGAAYLEQASITEEASARTALLETAESRLRTAQQINPLNTDHTANLARLYTRWADGSADDPVRQAELVDSAKLHYVRALELSPQNSTIWNEYANLLLTLGGDCDAGIEAYEHSLDVDPNYEVTHLGLAGAYQACAEAQEPEQREAYLERSAELVLSALELSGSDRGAYLFQAAQLFRQAGDYERALAALEELRELNDGSVAEWQLLLEIARAHRVGGDLTAATEFALEALAAAPADQQPTVQQFLDRVAEQQQEEE
jgi:tetratricopeptide (TPR) repeat protein